MKKNFELNDVAEITDAEWDLLIKITKETRSEKVIACLREKKNAPITAVGLFGPEDQNSGQIRPNWLFLKHKLPFLLTRIGELDKTAWRGLRLMALVRKTE